MPKGTHASRPPNRPEHKIGPYAAGIGVAIWLNTIDTEHGPRQRRSSTIAPRRSRDPQSGEWRDAPSYCPSDLPALVLALQKAMEYCYVTPIPGQEEQALVIPEGSIIVKNIWRDFGVLCARAGVPRYGKPLHSLRKSCITA